ncbi:60S ribosomal protein L24 [Irineochytrium annulatum]|nr:60S ribosomal protein L24 [Irineochytrium annulatum]
MLVLLAYPRNRTEICNFSGFKIYPGHGRTYVRADNRSFRFINGKCESYFLQRLKPSKLDWTVVFRRLHKKGQSEEVTKKRSKKTVKAQRAVVGASLDAIKAKRAQKPEFRANQRQKAMAEAKEKKKQEQEKKKAEKAKVAGPAAKGAKVSKQQAKGSAPKVQAKSR